MKLKHAVRFTALLIASALVFALVGCGKTPEPGDGSDRLNVVCTLFPQYDFVRQIAGDKVDLTLLLTPGADSHTYDPSPTDMVRINNCDLFLYTGDLMEIWAANVIKGLDRDKVTVLDLSQGIQLSAVEHEGHEEHEEEHEAEEHDHSVDPHIWTSPKNAVIMAQRIAAALQKLDPANADSYKDNAAVYCKELLRLDAQFRSVVAAAPLKEIVVCDRFAMHYFCREYGLTYMAAFDSCTSDTEPSPAVLAKITEHVKAAHIPAVFYAELSNQTMAKKVASLTGAKALELHSCHNLSAEQFSSGATYLDLMEQNLQMLKIALGVSQ